MISISNLLAHKEFTTNLSQVIKSNLMMSVRNVLSESLDKYSYKDDKGGTFVEFTIQSPEEAIISYEIKQALIDKVMNLDFADVFDKFAVKTEEIKETSEITE